MFRFRDKSTGTVIEVQYEHDAASIRRQSEYEEVVNQPTPETQPQATPVANPKRAPKGRANG